VGGAFDDVNGDPASDNLVRCSATTGAYIGSTVDASGDLGGRVQALAADSGGNLFVGGQFIDADGIPEADYVARYDGASWTALGTGLGGAGTAAIDTANVDALATDGTDVYVGTDDDDVAGIPQADHVALWNGSAWSAVGSNTAGGDGYFPAGGLTAVNDLLAVGSSLYATGQWANANGDPLADNVAIFSGGAWNHLGSNAAGTSGAWIGAGNALAFFGGAPIAGGAFVDAGGDSLADRIASFPPPSTPPTNPPTDPDPIDTGETPTDPQTPADTTGPDADFDKVPKGKLKTDEKKAKVKFEFSAEPGATFTCSLDEKPAKACTSPATVKVKPGKHTFEIQATDAAGNPGESVVDKFKVVRKG
jgi:hypothetical protein